MFTPWQGYMPGGMQSQGIQPPHVFSSYPANQPRLAPNPASAYQPYVSPRNLILHPPTILPPGNVVPSRPYSSGVQPVAQPNRQCAPSELPIEIASSLRAFETYVNGEKREYERRMTELHVRVRGLEDQIAQERVTASEERKQIKSSTKQEKKALKIKIQTLESEVLAAKEKMRQSFLSQIGDHPEQERLLKDLATARDRAASLETQLSAIQSEYSQSTLMEEAHRTKMDGYVKQLMGDSKKYQEECGELGEKLDRVTKDLESARLKARELERDKEHNIQLQEILKQKVAAKEQEFVALQQSQDILAREHLQVSEQQRIAVQQREELKQDLAKKQGEVTRLKEWLSSAKAAAINPAEAARLKDDLATLTKQKESLEQSEKEAREALQESEQRFNELQVSEENDKPVEDANLSLMFKVNKLEALVREQSAKLLAAERVASVPEGEDVFACLRGEKSPREEADWLEPLVVSDQFLKALPPQ